MPIIFAIDSIETFTEDFYDSFVAKSALIHPIYIRQFYNMNR